MNPNRRVFFFTCRYIYISITMVKWNFTKGGEGDVRGFKRGFKEN